MTRELAWDFYDRALRQQEISRDSEWLKLAHAGAVLALGFLQNDGIVRIVWEDEVQSLASRHRLSLEDEGKRR